MGQVSYFDLKASREDYHVVEKIVKDMVLENFAHRNANELSGGELAEELVEAGEITTRTSQFDGEGRPGVYVCGPGN
jgi:ABC-type hemin transport system ATPase subunit